MSLNYSERKAITRSVSLQQLLLLQPLFLLQLLLLLQLLPPPAASPPPLTYSRCLIAFRPAQLEGSWTAGPSSSHRWLKSDVSVLQGALRLRASFKVLLD